MATDKRIKKMTGNQEQTGMKEIDYQPEQPVHLSIEWLNLAR